MRYFITLLVSFVIAGASSAAFAQSSFWESLNGEQDSTWHFVKLTNPQLIERDTTWINGNIDHVDTIFKYDTNAYDENLGTITQMSQRHVWDIVILPSGSIVLATDIGIMISNDSAKTWSLSNDGLAVRNEMSTLCVGANGALYTGSSEGLYRSTDDGAHWDSLPVKPFTGKVYSVRYSPSGWLFVTDQGNNVWRTSNDGDSWTFIRAGGYETAIYQLATSSTGTLFGVDLNGLGSSTDNGATWTYLYPNNKDRWLRFGIDAHDRITVAHANTDSLVGGTAYIFDRSGDLGSTWSSLTGLSDTIGGYWKLGAAPGGQIVLGGVQWMDDAPYKSRYATSDSIQDVTFPKLRNAFVCFAFDSSGHVYGGTAGNGLFRSSSALPNRVSLAGVSSPGTPTIIVSPNPCANALTVTGIDDASVSIYDAAGKSVLKGHLSTKGTLDVHELPNGIYEARAESPKISTTFRFVVWR